MEARGGPKVGDAEEGKRETKGGVGVGGGGNRVLRMNLPKHRYKVLFVGVP